MVKRYNRLLVAFHVVSDAMLAALAFVLAYVLRFESGLIPVPKGYPPFERYINVLPLVAGLVVFAYYLQGLYRLRRGRSRVDDFFAVFVGSILAVVLGHVVHAVLPGLLRQRRAEAGGRPRGVAARLGDVPRAERRAHVRVARAGAAGARAPLARRHRPEAGADCRRRRTRPPGGRPHPRAPRARATRSSGSSTTAPGGDHLGYRGLPLLGTLAEAGEIAQRERIDQLYVALPLDEHTKMLQVVEDASREGLDIKVVPDLLQFIALRARLEELDGVPIININDVPLQGLNSALKRAVDIVLSAVALLVLAIPLAIIALLIRLTSPGPVFYHQERMGLDGRAFTVYKFRSMFHRRRARDRARSGRATTTRGARRSAGSCAASTSTSCRRSGTCFKGDMSLVGPRPERPYFVEQFKQQYPAVHAAPQGEGRASPAGRR